MSQPTPTDTTAPDTAALREIFSPIFTRIAERTAERERRRELAFDAVGWLRAAGFGRLRVPLRLGGLGASPEQLFELLAELGAADSNLPQIFRAHLGAVERLLAEIGPPQAERWLRLAGDGAFFGNATTEPGDGALGTLGTVLRPDGAGDWLLDGEKYYSTGTLYADWISVSVRIDGHSDPRHRLFAFVPADAPGVERVDDWRGFGQRLTASGTTRFTRVHVPAESVLRYRADRPTVMTSVFQTIHLATLAGIAQAVAHDAARFVRQRRRTFSNGTVLPPAQDPLVQSVVGELAANAFSARANVQAVARQLGEIDRLRSAGTPVPESLLVDLELSTSSAQIAIIDGVLRSAGKLFDVGGASALQEVHDLDRHWRNARTLASHNPAINKARILGDHAINGTVPTFYWSVGSVPAPADTAGAGSRSGSVLPPHQAT